MRRTGLERQSRLNFKPKTVIKGYRIEKKAPLRVELELPMTAQVMGLSAPEHDPEHVTLWAIQHSEDVESKVTNTFISVRENEPFDIDDECENSSCFHAQPIGMWTEREVVDGVEKVVSIHLLEVMSSEDGDEFDS